METDFGHGNTVYLITDPDKMHWIITHLKVDINECVKFRISNGYGKRWVFAQEICLAENDEPGKIGFNVKKC